MIKKQLNESVKDSFKEKAKDRIYIFLLANGAIRGAFIYGTRMIKEMRANFDLGVLETLVLGQAYLGCGLLSSNLKGNDRIGFKIDCSGPIKGISVETNAFGEVRGSLKQAQIPVDKSLEDFNLSPFFGAGLLTVTKYLEDAKQPYAGRIALLYGSIAKDLANYFYSSEQIPTVFNLSIKFNTNGEVTGAGGFLLQLMPDASDELAKNLENIINDLPSIGNLIEEDKAPDHIICESFKGLAPKILNDYRVEFFCRCNENMMLNYLSMFSEKDKEEILENGPFPLQIRCHNCNSLYEFSKKEISSIFKKKNNS
ncbi:MAG: Hsp33 family molecular chaperone HslO [Desulfobacterium sp.]|nr:Hsp33 family molecular chaperone HslO [Desulfobacterium sp.]MBU3950212.1 Hsp33 family molecular chaperone HslO [Pseudomonadota bacterium]MBU4009438.1 Hsp33 family molecular chaperone HslO [Pseudomonadota bacterium]MBU4037300.1 Hsp33 family molecular chaperone HslO [Pseudomonadota bacterium]